MRGILRDVVSTVGCPAGFVVFLGCSSLTWTAGERRAVLSLKMRTEPTAAHRVAKLELDLRLLTAVIDG